MQNKDHDAIAEGEGEDAEEDEEQPPEYEESNEEGEGTDELDDFWDADSLDEVSIQKLMLQDKGYSRPDVIEAYRKVPGHSSDEALEYLRNPPSIASEGDEEEEHEETEDERRKRIAKELKAERDFKEAENRRATRSRNKV